MTVPPPPPTTDSDHYLLVTDDDGVRTITIARPEKMNAVTPAMVRRYTALLLAAAADPEVRVIVVTGKGRSFCAGIDTATLQALDSGAARSEKLRRHWFTTRIPKPVIGAINGACVGLGVVLAMMCDMRVANRSAHMGAGFTRVGLPAEHALTWSLVHSVGYARAFEFLARGRSFAGTDLMRLGLVNEVVDDAQLNAHVIEIARGMADLCSPHSLAMLKRQLHGSILRPVEEVDAEADRLIAASLNGPDFQEAMMARRQERKPQFAGIGADTDWWPLEPKPLLP